MHCHQELSKFCLTNVLQFWQTCSCWNDLDSFIMDKATLLKVAANTKVAYPESREKKGGGQNKLCPWWWEPISCHQTEKAFHFFELSTGWQITSESTVERDHCSVTCWSICVKFLLNTSNQRCQELIKSVQGGLRVRSGVQGNDLKKYNKINPKKFFC